MTEKLFYKDQYKQECDAVVEQILPPSDGRPYGVVLDRTCFYPEGGGQPADTGTIAGLPVVDVRKNGEAVLHLCGELPPFGVGEPVHCTLDWEHRYDFMQQHTGQHLISAAFYQLEGINTVSVHLGDQYSTVELDVESLEQEGLEAAEREANRMIGRNLPVETQWVAEEELDLTTLRRAPKVSGTIRVVAVEGVDRAACGGVHVARTGEIGLLKLIGTETIRGHVRTIWKIGRRAFDDYATKTAVCSRLSEILSAPIEELEAATRQLADRLVAAQRRATDSETKRAVAVAASLRADKAGAITGHFEAEDEGFMKAMVASFLSETEEPFCLTNLSDGRLRWHIGGSALDQAQGKRFLAELLPLIDGKGGGKPPVWQGVGIRGDSAHDFLAAFRKLVADAGP